MHAVLLQLLGRTLGMAGSLPQHLVRCKLHIFEVSSFASRQTHYGTGCISHEAMFLIY